MTRVVLDTNTVVSAQLKLAGLEAMVLLLASRGDVALFVSLPILAEYQRVLYKPKLKFDPRLVEAVADIGRASRLVHPLRTLTEAKHEPDNRFLECAETDGADFLVTGNKKHFPDEWGPSQIVNAREFMDQTALWDERISNP